MLEKWKLFDLYNCEPIFQFQCPRQWAQLRETAEPGVRFCDTCRKSVYFCATPEEFVRQGELGRCVALASEVTIKRELVEERESLTMLGFPNMDGIWQAEKVTTSFWEEVLELDPDLPLESRTLTEAEVRVEAQNRREIEIEKSMTEHAVRQAAWQETERIREERQVKVRAALAKIEAMSDWESWGQVGNCPKCGFSHRWDGTHCSHCGHSPAADAAGWPPL